MHESDGPAEAGDDPLLAWASQGSARFFTHGSATAVASPGLAHRDRLAVSGRVEDLVVLVPEILAEVGPTFRPIGDADTIKALVAAVPALTLVAKFGWMDASAPTLPGSGGTGGVATLTRARVEWLTAADARDISGLIDAAYPSSIARPGTPGVTRWAGLRDCAGRLAAVGADAWSSPTVGFLAGTASHPAARGRGHAAATCGFLLNSMIAEYGRAALLVDSWNCAAIRLAKRLGLTYRPVAAARTR